MAHDPNGFNDISGCGLEGCERRYEQAYPNIDSCKGGCDTIPHCVAFSWAPMGDDKNHVHHSVCTLYDSPTPTQRWGPTQVFCINAYHPHQHQSFAPQEIHHRVHVHHQFGGSPESSDEYDDGYQSALPMVDLLIMYGGGLVLCGCISGCVCFIFGVFLTYFVRKSSKNGKIIKTYDEMRSND